MPVVYGWLQAALYVGASTFASCKELLVPLSDGGYIGLSTRGSTAFRIRVLKTGQEALLDTPMIDPSIEDAAFEELPGSEPSERCLRAAAGVVCGDGGGVVTLRASLGGPVLTSSLPLTSTSTGLVLSGTRGPLYGRGASPSDAETLLGDDVRPLVANRGTYVPYYYSQRNGYGALGAVALAHTYHYEANYNQSPSGAITWTFSDPWELYLMPAASLSAGTKAYYSLIGAPRVPPRYAFGFLASRWGWKDPTYVEEVLTKFRGGSYPIDAIIFDFEWFTNESDYNFKPIGRPYYHDFAFNDQMFPDPSTQLQRYFSEYNIRVGGIRKPRLGNSDALKDLAARGWLLPNGEANGNLLPLLPTTYADHRNINFSNVDARAWYATQIEPLLDSGMSFWWNDEGETEYFTFYWWNVAQKAALAKLQPTKRFFSINRAFAPGIARLGVTVWTGDISATWSDLQQTPGMMLNWVLAGAPYVTCDAGGFGGETNGELLTRWLQISTFMPVMRVHSTKEATPHFPWLFGDEAAAAIQRTLNLRYQLIPYHYSLAHQMYQNRKLWIRPMVMDYPDDEAAMDLTTEWLDGDILVSPVLKDDSHFGVYLPEGLWYSVNGTLQKQVILHGPQQYTAVATLSEVPAFVKAGTILPMGPVIQHSGALPGGPLEVQIYAGADGSFELIEDDGESTGYERGDQRSTQLTWNQDAMTLSWKVTNDDSAAASGSFFRQLFVAYFAPDGTATQTPIVDLGSEGLIKVSRSSVPLTGQSTII